MNQIHKKLCSGLGFTGLECWIWMTLAFILAPASFYYRFYELSAPLLDPHPWRQSQTALTIYYYAKEGINLWQYPNALGGEAWNFTREFPLYQAIVALVMKSGIGLESASRLVTQMFFLGNVFFLFKIARHLFNVRVAAWTVVIFLTSPFAIIFSRTCLIDFSTQFFSLASVYFFLKKRWALFLFTGLVTAVMKLPIFLFSSGMISLYLLMGYLKKREERNTLVKVALLLAVQTVIAAIWYRHAQQTYRLDISDGELTWLMGEGKMRLSLAFWKDILKVLLRSVLSDWMVIPCAIGMFFARRSREWLWITVLLAIVSISVWFNTHLRHDYYFLIEAPYLFLLAAVGITEMIGTARWQKVAVGIVMVIGLRSAYQSRLALETITENYRDQLHTAELVKRLTDPNEVVFMRKVQLEVALYSERYVVVPEPRATGGVSPKIKDRISAYLLSEDDSLSPLKEEKQVWISGETSELVVYRTRGLGSFALHPERDVVSSDLPGGRPLTASVGEWVDACDRKVSAWVETTGRSVSSLGEEVVLETKSGKLIRMPKRRYLSLPSHSAWGCQFRLAISPTAGE